MITQYEGDEVRYAISVPSHSLHDARMYFYKKGSTVDVSNVYFKGSMLIDGNRIITKQTNNLKKGDWIVSVSALVDGYNRTVLSDEFKVYRKSEFIPKGEREVVEAVSKCTYCGSWGASKCACPKCGAPID